MFKKFFSKTLVIFFIFTSLVSAEISYREILDNPTDLELNLNYAKQQEKAGNLKLTISTLERMSMLYPSNTEIKLYLLSIVVKMDSPAKQSACQDCGNSCKTYYKKISCRKRQLRFSRLG